MLEPELNPTNPLPSTPPAPETPAPATPEPEATPTDMVEVIDAGGVRTQVPRADFEKTAREKWGIISGFEKSQAKARERGAKQAVDALLKSIESGEENETVKRVKDLLGRSAAPAGADAAAVVAEDVQAILDDPEITAEAETNPVTAKLVEALKKADSRINRLVGFTEKAFKDVETKLSEGGRSGLSDVLDEQDFVAQARKLTANPKARALFSYEGAGDIRAGLQSFADKYADYIEKTEDATPMTFGQFVSNVHRTHFGSELEDASPAPVAPKPGDEPQPLPVSPGAVARGGGAAGQAHVKDAGEMTQAEWDAHFARTHGRSPKPSDLLGKGGAKAAADREKAFGNR